MNKTIIFHKISPVATLIMALVFAVWPLLRPGFIPTHDGEYHLVRFYEFEKMLRAGYLFPRWAPGLNSGYGIPIFNFHYPLPNYLGVFYHSLHLSLSDSFKLSLATGYIAATMFCFLWLKNFFKTKVSLAASVVFAYTPYWFVDIYVRGSIGEVLSIAWVMLCLFAVEAHRPFVVSLAVAGMIISHNILALIFVPILFAYSTIRAPRYVINLLLGVACAAYFWLPAIGERQFVTGLNSVNYLDHFPHLDQLIIPSWGTGFSNTGLTGLEMSPQIGIIPLALITIALFVYLWDKQKENKTLIRFSILSVLIAFFLMLDSSKPIWEKVVILQYLQYPWRLLSVFLPITAFLAAYIFSKFKNKLVIILICMASIFLSYQYTRPVVYAVREDKYYLTKSEFTDGTSSLGNSFSTIWTSWKKNKSINRIESINGNSRVETVEVKPLYLKFNLDTHDTDVIRVNTLFFPGWRAWLNDKESKIDYFKDGLISFNVKPGTYKVEIKFTETKLRLFADVMSLLSLFWLIAWAILKIRYEYNN